jgi:hypothetical protein
VKHSSRLVQYVKRPWQVTWGVWCRLYGLDWVPAWISRGDILTGGTPGRGRKLMDQIDQKSMLFQHFPHTFCSYRFMVGVLEADQSPTRAQGLVNDHAEQRSSFWSVFILFICRQVKLSEQKMACGTIGSLLSIEGPLDASLLFSDKQVVHET